MIPTKSAMEHPHITSEDDFLDCIGAIFPASHPSLALGRGDDCAEILCPPQLAVSTDLFVEDVHFRRNYFSPFEIGYKAMAVNISDIAAAGAVPLGVSIGLVAPVPFPREEAMGILQGIRKAALDHDIALSGGDLSRGDKLVLCVTIWGGPVNQDRKEHLFLRRGPVAPGHVLFLCGRVGLARAGLLLLEERGKIAEEEFPASLAAHLLPEPRVAAGLALAAIPGCRLMDVSDGLARDLPRMLAAYGASCGAEVTLPEKLLHPETIRYARLRGEDPPLFAFLGGEDYALLGACPPEAWDRVRGALCNLPGGSPCETLGTVTAGPDIILNGTPFADCGFDHFTQKKNL